MAKLFHVTRGSGREVRTALMASEVMPAAERMACALDRKLRLGLDLNPAMRGKLLSRAVMFSSSHRGFPEKVLRALDRGVNGLDPINRLLKPLRLSVARVSGSNRLIETVGAREKGKDLLDRLFAPAMLTNTGIILHQIDPQPRGTQILFSTANGVGGQFGERERAQKDVLSIIAYLVDLKGRSCTFDRKEILKSYSDAKKTNLDAGLLEDVLISLEKLLYIRKSGDGFVIYDQAVMIQEITRTFMEEADKPENHDLDSLIKLFTELLGRVFTNVDVYLYRDSEHDEALLVERLTGSKDLSQYFPDWRPTQKTRKEINDQYMRAGKVVMALDLGADEAFVDQESRKKDVEVFADPHGKIFSGVLGVRVLDEEENGNTILGGVTLSNLTPKAKFSRDGMGPEAIIGKQMNPSLYGEWLISENSVQSALSNLLNQMAIRMQALLSESGMGDIRELWEATTRSTTPLAKPSVGDLRAFISSLPGVPSAKTFKAGDRKEKVRILSIDRPGSLRQRDKELLAYYLDNASRRAFERDSGVEVAGYGEDFVLKHFLGVDKLMIALDNARTDIVAFAGTNLRTFKLKLGSGEEVFRPVWVVESVMVMPDYQSFNIGPHLMYKLLLEALLGNKLEPIDVVLRTAVPRAYGAILRTFPDSLYPNARKPLIDPARATEEERVVLQMLGAASQHINPGNEFDPATGAARGVYDEASGLRLTPDRILWDKDLQVNDFVSGLLGFDKENGNTEGNAMILYFVADAQARKKYERAKGIGVVPAAKAWLQDQLLRLIRAKG